MSKIETTINVKDYYENAAVNRFERLTRGSLNSHKINHFNRSKIIRKILGNIRKSDSALDIGTGTGVWAEELTNYCNRVVGVDFAKKNIEIATKRSYDLNLSQNLSYVLDDVQHLKQFNERSFDIVMNISVIQHLSDQLLSLKNAHRILNPGGYMILLVHNKTCFYNRNLIKNKNNIKINLYKTLNEYNEMLFDAGFIIKSIQFCWIFFLDFAVIGISNPYLSIFLPFRKIMINSLLNSGIWFSKIKYLERFYREIIFTCIKE